jgi:hypothetical protein
MSTSGPKSETARVKNVRVTSRALVVDLRDGRTVSAPLDWYPRLGHGTLRERQRCELIGAGVGTHWPALDEGPSRESDASFTRWLNSRPRQANRRLQPTKARRRTGVKRGSGVRLPG